MFNHTVRCIFSVSVVIKLKVEFTKVAGYPSLDIFGDDFGVSRGMSTNLGNFG